MSTTTVRLPEELKARISRLAQKTGTTPHGLILEAIAEKADQLERRASFHEEAERRFGQILASGKTIPWSEMRSWLEAKAAGNEVARPVARKLAR